jgi:hypothetical protein
MIELCALGEDTYKCSFASRGISKLFCNKFYTAGILTAMIIILIMVIYPCKKGTPVFIVFKLAFYILIFTYMVIFVHDGVLHQITEKENDDAETSKFIGGLGETNVVYGGDNIEVNPTVSAGGEDSVIESIKGGSTAEDVFAMYGV